MQALRELDDATDDEDDHRSARQPPPSQPVAVRQPSRQSLPLVSSKKRQLSSSEQPSTIQPSKRSRWSANVNDVLFGRGSGSALNEGNHRFRQLIMEYREPYLQAAFRAEKNAIAQTIMNEVIFNRQGRFLRMVEDLEFNEMMKEINNDPMKKQLYHSMVIPIDNTRAWVVAEPDIVLEKVKQVRFFKKFSLL
jgi:hypothetical protein